MEQKIHTQVLSLGGRYIRVQQGKQEQRLLTQTEQEVISSQLAIPNSISFNIISPKVRYEKVHLKSLMRHRCLTKDNYSPLKLDR